MHSPEYIVIHHSLTKDSKTLSAQAIRKAHKAMAWVDIGYHYVIERVANHYEIICGRMMNEIGAHCKEFDMNSKSIGICLIGNFDIEPPPVAQWKLALKLVQSLCDVLGISKYNVKGHRDYATYKSCPGRLFDMGKFRSELH
jgi:N-acetylmuramoyl-L-alanine amidase